MYGRKEKNVDMSVFLVGKRKLRNENLLTQGHSRSEAGKGLETQIS